MENISRFIQQPEGIKVIHNCDMVCRNCRYMKEYYDGECENYDCKPVKVLEGGACDKFVGRRKE